MQLRLVVDRGAAQDQQIARVLVRGRPPSEDGGAFRMIEAGQKATKEATAAKFFAAETCFQVANDALQVLGGIGYTTDYPVERIFRDLRVAPISEGGTEVMKFLTQREVYRDMGY